MQHRNQLLPSARDGKHAEIQTFADEITFALGHEQRQRKDTSQRRIGLRVPKSDALALGVVTGAKIKHDREQAAHAIATREPSEDAVIRGGSWQYRVVQFDAGLAVTWTRS